MNKKLWCVCLFFAITALSACGGGENSSTLFQSSTESISSTQESVSTEDSSTEDTSTDDRSVDDTQTITIYYDLGECPNATIPALTQTVRVGETFALYVPYVDESNVTVYGYDFIKWLNKADNTEFTGGVCNFTEDIHLLAVWEKYTPDIPLSYNLSNPSF